MHIVILYSGGLDSLIMRKLASLTHPQAKITCVYFDIGHKYAHKEKAVLPADVEICDMSWFAATEHAKDGSSSGSIIIPGRNMMFATIAACKYLPDQLWLGALLGEMHLQSTDKNDLFRSMLNATLGYVNSPFYPKWPYEIVRFPLAELGWGKLEATRWAYDAGMEEEILKSSSCLSEEDGNCGHCVVCARRWGIFKQLGLQETYNSDPISGQNLEMMIRMVADQLLINSGKKQEADAHYDKYRRNEIIPALQMEYDAKDLQTILEALVARAATKKDQ